MTNSAYVRYSDFHIESRGFFRVGRLTHAILYLHYLLPHVGNIGYIGTYDIPMVTLVKP